MSRETKLPRAVRFGAILAASLAAAWLLTVRGVGWWLDFGEAPVKSDAILVLAGNFERPAYAAELFAAGDAPEIWIGRPRRLPSLAQLDAMGISYPREEDVDREILLKLGVPKERVRLYGRDLNSTADEGEALRAEFPPAGKKILVVTSRYHARRARLILRRVLPEAEIRVAAKPDAEGGRRWWGDKEMAQNGISEILKTVFFLAGGRYR
jgi:uncharacterized SAM-binding protein YcdF (DUF218 family)